MTAQENSTASISGDQVKTESLPQPVEPTAEKPEGASQETPSYFSSQESLKNKINELTSIAETGTSEDITKAMDELGRIEQHLLKAKEKPVQTTDTKPEDSQDKQKLPSEAVPQKNESGDAPKKFTVHWQGKAIERDDSNNLLGYKSTGELKAALVKAQLQIDEHRNQNASLIDRLRDADEKMKGLPTKTVQPPTPQPVTPTLAQQPALTRPVPPKEPALSTSDPTLYTEEDIAAVDAHRKATAEFQQKLIDYVASLENRYQQPSSSILQEIEKTNTRLKKIEEGQREIDAAKQRLAEEKADLEHWKQFTDFQDKHTAYKTSVPIKQLNDTMNEWMDNIAAANGVKPPQNSDGYNEYYRARAQVVTNFLHNDAQTIQNAQGIKPPEDYETFFKLLELNNARKKYQERGINGNLHQIYLLMKDESGEIDQSLESIRLTERTKAAEQFATGTQQFQQTAVTIDPNQSAGGPDANELGIPSSDLQWFKTITPDKLHDLKYKNKSLFDKWNAIADKIESYVR